MPGSCARQRRAASRSGHSGRSDAGGAASAAATSRSSGRARPRAALRVAIPAAPAKSRPGLRHAARHVRTARRHNAHVQPGVVTVHYPHHPLAGRSVAVVRWRRSADGTLVHVTGPDGGVLGIPEWMTRPASAVAPLRKFPRLSVGALSDAHTLVNDCLSAEEATTGGDLHETPTRISGLSVPAAGTDASAGQPCHRRGDPGPRQSDCGSSGGGDSTGGATGTQGRP